MLVRFTDEAVARAGEAKLGGAKDGRPRHGVMSWHGTTYPSSLWKLNQKPHKPQDCDTSRETNEHLSAPLVGWLLYM